MIYGEKQMLKRTISIIMFILLIFCAAGCTADIQKNDKLSIITTIFPAYDFARAVAGDMADVTMLLSPGAEIHSFDPTPRDMTAILHCDLFIYNGGESDAWVEKLLSSSEYKDVKTLRMTDCVKLYDEEIKEGMEDKGGDDEKEADEHVWTSPVNAISIVNAIAVKLTDIDGRNAGTYMTNAQNYTMKLTDLDMRFKKAVEKIQNKTLVFADRFPMRYFTEQYGFDYYAAFPGCSSQTEPSAATITFLIKKINDENIPAVFTIEFSDGRLADTICAETNAKKYTLHSCHNVTAEDFNAGKTYIDIMNDNLNTLTEAFNIG